MKTGERIFNLLLSASVLSWALLGLSLGPTGADVSPVRLTITALHLCVALLILLRGPVRTGASMRSMLSCLPALLVSGWALRIAEHADSWPWHSQGIFVAGGLLTIVTFVSLGKSFSVLPALRTLVTKGAFRVVRHPAYLGELLMILGCVLASDSSYALLPLLAAIPFVARRILEEEKLLSLDASYATYRQGVPWRLIPRVW